MFMKPDLIQKTAGIFLTVLRNSMQWVGANQIEMILMLIMIWLSLSAYYEAIPDVRSKGWPAPPPSCSRCPGSLRGTISTRCTTASNRPTWPSGWAFPWSNSAAQSPCMCIGTLQKRMLNTIIRDGSINLIITLKSLVNVQCAWHGLQLSLRTSNLNLYAFLGN